MGGIDHSFGEQRSQGRFARRGELARGAKAVVAATLLLGMLASVLWARAAENERVDQRQSTAQESAELIRDQASARLGLAITAVQRFSLTTVAQWPSEAEFNAAFEDLSAELPGDSTALVIIHVPPQQREAFAEAERLTNPDFSLVPVGPQSLPSDELVVMRRAADAGLVDIDPLPMPDLADRLLRLPATGVHVLSTEQGTTDSTVDLVVRSKAQGPDGERHDSWTIVHVDLVEVFADVHLVAGPDFGVSLALDAVGPVGTFGTDKVGAQLISETLPAGPVELAVQVWSKDAIAAETSTSWRLIAGVLATTGLTVVAYLVLALAENRRQARVQGEQARRDHLTGIPNRRWVVEHLARLKGESIAVLFCDLDRFKVVNDAAGHGAGDDVLVQVVGRMQSVLDPCCTIARFGGDEFLIVCSSNADIVDHASSTASRINAAMTDPFPFGSSEFSTTISIGIAVAEGSTGTSAEELIRAADVALGLCKQRGRNGAVLYDDTLREAELDRLALERDLRASLDRGDLTLHYQPIVDNDERILSFEALVRWVRNDELLAPGAFLPVVEEIGRMSDLGEIVLRKAVAEFAAGIDPASSTTLHVNVDAQQLADPQFPVLVREVIVEHDLAPHRLILELTEGDWAQSIQGMTPVLDELSNLGVRLAIDDFGAGYSNIGRALAVRGLAEIKLDRSLIRDMFQARNHAFVSGLADTMLAIGVVVIAEGIETVEDFRCAQGAGLQHFQGFLFARPGPASEVNFAAVQAPVSRLGPTPNPSPVFD